MNNIKFLHTVLICTILSLCVVACSKDDNDENISQIIGSWTCSNHYYYGPDTYTFNNNGRYYWTCSKYPDPSNSTENGVYTYNINSGLLTLCSDKGISRLYIVSFSSSDTFLLTDEDGYSYTYRRK